MNFSPEMANLLWALKVIWVSFMLGSWMIWRLRKGAEWLFVLALGLFLAGSYALLAASSKTLFWGMSGDESFIVSIFQHQAWGRFGADFTSHQLPLFYPPLYFMMGGIIGKILILNGIGMAKVMAMSTFLGAPLVVFSLLRFWCASWLSKEYAALTVALLFAALPYDAMILKPYEMISGIALVITFAGIAYQIWNQGALSRWQWLMAAISLVFLFLLFYFWFILLIAAVLTLVAIGSRKKEMMLSWSILGIITLLGSIWYWLPNVISFVRFGYENWQPLFFVLDDLRVFSPFASVLNALAAILFLTAIGTMIGGRRMLQVKIFSAAVLAAYGYQALQIGIFFLGGRPMQPSKGFLFFALPALVMLAVIGIQKYKSMLDRRAIAALIVGASFFMLPARALEDSRLQAQIEKNIQKNFSQEYITDALRRLGGIKDLTILTSGSPEWEARVPYQEYVAHNINLAHPALGFTERHDFIKTLAQSQSPEEFAGLFRQAPRQSIDAMLLFHDQEKYYLFYWLDNFPQGGREEVISFPRELIAPSYFSIQPLSSEFDLILPILQ